MSFDSIIETLSHFTSATIYLSQPDEHIICLDNEYIELCCGYNLDHNLITMYIHEVEDVAFAAEMREEEVFKYILLHEIGHSLDGELGYLNAQDTSKATFKSEVNAWRIADDLVGEQTYNYRLLRAWALSNYDPDNQWIAKYCPDYFQKQ